jgi:hypothetical protein
MVIMLILSCLVSAGIGFVLGAYWMYVTTTNIAAKRLNSLKNRTNR